MALLSCKPAKLSLINRSKSVIRVKAFLFFQQMSHPLRYIILALLAVAAPATLGAAASGVSPAPYELTTVFGFPLTNAMVTSWVISLLLIILVRVAVGKPKMIPGRGQAIIENLVTALRDLLEPIVGKKAFPVTFPFLCGFFLFIMVHNWSGLLPGVGSFGYYDDQGTLKYWMRPANSDLNTTLGMAIVAMIAWFVISLKVVGPRFFIWELFGNKADKKETPKAIFLALIPIFILVGFIELISIAFRPVSLSFRLYGNIFGGENLLDSMTNLAPFVVPTVFYFYEVLVGVVQALIFTLLFAIYIGLLTNHEEDHAH